LLSVGPGAILIGGRTLSLVLSGAEVTIEEGQDALASILA